MAAEALSLQCPHKSGFHSCYQKNAILYILFADDLFFFKSLSPEAFRIFYLIPAVVQFHNDLSCYGIFS